MKTFRRVIAGVIAAAITVLPVGAAMADETSASSDTSAATTEQIDFEYMHGSQFAPFLDHQYVYDGEEVPLYFSNFIIVNQFFDLCSYSMYGYAPITSEGFVDLSADFTDYASFYGGDYATFGEFLVAYSENTMECTLMLKEKADAEGLTLTADTQDQIDQMVDSLENDTAASLGLTLDEYLACYFGESMNEENFRDVLNTLYLTQAYSKEYNAAYNFTYDEKYLQTIRYALFYAPSGSSDEDLAAAEEAANALLAECTNIDDLKAKAADLNASGEVYETNDITFGTGEMVPEFEAWAFDEARYEGELGVVKSEAYGYFVVGYLGKTEKDEDALLSVSSKYLGEELAAEMENHTFSTDDAYEAAVPVAASTETVTTAPSATDASVQATDPVTGEPVPAAENADAGKPSTIEIVFIALGGVAIAGVIAILIGTFIGGNKAKQAEGKNSAKNSKKAKETESKDEE